MEAGAGRQGAGSGGGEPGAEKRVSGGKRPVPTDNMAKTRPEPWGSKSDSREREREAGTDNTTQRQNEI